MLELRNVEIKNKKEKKYSSNLKVSGTVEKPEEVGKGEEMTLVCCFKAFVSIFLIM